MKKPGIPIILIITVAVLAFTLGFFFGSSNHKPAVLSVPDAMYTLPADPVPQIPAPSEISDAGHDIRFPININTATKLEFMELPGIGEELAKRILKYREVNGPFQKIEELIVIIVVPLLFHAKAGLVGAVITSVDLSMICSLLSHSVEIVFFRSRKLQQAQAV